MAEKKPLNELERVLAAAMKSEAALPDFYRQLLRSELWFLMPFHPEAEGIMELKPGTAIDLTAWNTLEFGEFIPLFTSQDRVMEGLAATKRSKKPYVLSHTQGLTIFQILATQRAMAIVNPACGSTGEARLPLPLIAALADGSLLRPSDDAEGNRQETAKLTILDPADYPTDLIQQLFEFMRGHPNFRKAWIFGEGLPESREAGTYRLLLWMEPRDAQIEQDLFVVLNALDTPDRRCWATMVNAQEVAGFPWVPHIPAFYTAPTS